MKKFIAIYNTPVEAAKAYASASVEDKQKGMQAWLTWKAQNEQSIIDFGAPLLPGETLSEENSWSNSSSLVNGYSILQANSIEELKTVLKEHPHTANGVGASIEIKEFMPM